MDRSKQIAAELYNMIEAGDVQDDIIDEIVSMANALSQGSGMVEDYYRASTPRKILEVFDEVNQRVKR
ncbi:hypothetical protein [Peribacillus sp. SCS-155]|uniref:hypothetical protein n=1 Tax=Peribacillus sedimenti TaxID=3115297 RepID=UPI003905B456